MSSRAGSEDPWSTWLTRRPTARPSDALTSKTKERHRAGYDAGDPRTDRCHSDRRKGRSDETEPSDRKARRRVRPFDQRGRVDTLASLRAPCVQVFSELHPIGHVTDSGLARMNGAGFSGPK